MVLALRVALFDRRERVLGERVLERERAIRFGRRLARAERGEHASEIRGVLGAERRAGRLEVVVSMQSEGAAIERDAHQRVTSCSSGPT